MGQKFSHMLKNNSAVKCNDESKLKDLWEQMTSFNSLHQILKHGRISTQWKRKTASKNYFQLIQQRKILVGHLPGTGMSYIGYVPPQDLLKRFLSDSSVFEQYLRSGESSVRFPGQVVHKDFFSGQLYPSVLSTIPPEFQHLPPLLLWLYR